MIDSPCEPDLIDRLVAEGLIGANAAGKALGGIWRQTVARHMLRGIKLPNGQVLKLEHDRCGTRLMTSRAACLRFLKAQQTSAGEVAEEVIAEARPSRRNAKAKAAGKRLEARGA